MDFELADNAIIDADPFSHKGAKDGSATFSVKHDDKFIYVAARVVDDEILAKKGKNPLYQDAAVLYFDARPVNESSMNYGQNLFSDWIVVAISPDSEGTIYQKQRLPKGIKSAIKVNKKGYDVEIAIPADYLIEKQLGPWTTFRLNLMISDYDQSGNHRTKILWEPLWNEENNYIGSGTFFKQ